MKRDILSISEQPSGYRARLKWKRGTDQQPQNLETGDIIERFLNTRFEWCDSPKNHPQLDTLRTIIRDKIPLLFDAKEQLGADVADDRVQAWQDQAFGLNAFDALQKIARQLADGTNTSRKYLISSAPDALDRTRWGLVGLKSVVQGIAKAIIYRRDHMSNGASAELIERLNIQAGTLSDIAIAAKQTLDSLPPPAKGSHGRAA